MYKNLKYIKIWKSKLKIKKQIFFINLKLLLIYLILNLEPLMFLKITFKKIERLKKKKGVGVAYTRIRIANELKI